MRAVRARVTVMELEVMVMGVGVRVMWGSVRVLWWGGGRDTTANSSTTIAWGCLSRTATRRWKPTPCTLTMGEM